MNELGFPGLGIQFKVNEIAIPLPIGSGGIRWYALLILVGILLAMWVAVKETKRIGEDPDHVYNMVLWSLPCAIIGARLYYVLFSFQEYKNNLIEVFYIWEGGIAIYGGVLATLLVVMLYCRKHKLNLWKYLDIGAYGFLIGQCIGRWGNFFNAEAFGTETDLPWRMFVNGQTVHPTFLYESLWIFLIFSLIWFTRKKRYFPGRAATLYMVGYGIGRFMIEGLRTDSLYLGNLRISQLVSFSLVVLGIWFYGRKKRQYKFSEEVKEM